MITGRYPSRIGHWRAHDLLGADHSEARLTAAWLLKQNGYDNARIGKWHLGMDWGGKPGNEKTAPVSTQLRASPNAAGFDSKHSWTTSLPAFVIGGVTGFAIGFVLVRVGASALPSAISAGLAGAISSALPVAGLSVLFVSAQARSAFTSALVCGKLTGLVSACLTSLT